jgi:hypothetical protein
MTSELACFDGHIAPASETRIEVTDEGFIRGDGAFEVVRVYDGRPFALDEHLDRIERSVANLRMTWKPDRGELAREAAALLEARGVGEGDRVAILCRNRLAFFEALFACARLGAILVPLNWRMPPAELDTLLETLSGEPPVAMGLHEGEHLYASERLVVSPAAGVFAPADPWRAPAPEAAVGVGELLGTVGGREVRSLFEGRLMAMVAVEGERVTAAQPIAWLRVP